MALLRLLEVARPASWLAAGVLVLGCTVGCTVVPNPDYEPELGGTGDTADDGVDATTGSSDDGTDTRSDLGAGESTTTDSTGGTVIECAADPEPPAQPCPESCDACDEGTCRIACTEPDACKNEVLACPDGWPCEVECADKHACQNATLLCPDAHACDVVCYGDHTCEGLTVACGDGMCGLDCGNEDSCKDAEVACGGDTSVTCTEEQEGLVAVASDRTPCACSVDDRCRPAGEGGGD